MRHELQLDVRRVEDCDYVEASRKLSALGLEMRRRGPTAELLLRKAFLEIDAGNFAQAAGAAEDALASNPKLVEAQLVWGRALFYAALVRAGIMEGGPGHCLGNPGPEILASYRHVSEYLNQVPYDDDAETLCNYLDRLVLGNADSSRMVAMLRRDFSPTASQG